MSESISLSAKDCSPISSAMRWASVARKNTILMKEPRACSISTFNFSSTAMMSALATSMTNGIAPYVCTSVIFAIVNCCVTLLTWAALLNQ